MLYPWTMQPLPSELTRAAAAAAAGAKSSSPFLVCVPRESASHLLWQLLAGLSTNSSLIEFSIPCASVSIADIQFYIVRFARMDISILRIAQRAELSARLEF